MASLSCNIVLVPAAELAAKAIVTSQQSAHYGANQFVLKDGAYFPHATLYMCQIKIDDLGLVREQIAAIAAQTPVLTLAAKKYDQPDGYIDIEYDREALADLQMKVVGAINPIRDGLRDNDKARLPEATSLIRENLENYGYRGVGELFRPHITFTRFADNKVIDTTEFPPVSNFDGVFDRLGLFEMGDDGTCVRKIAEFPLS